MIYDNDAEEEKPRNSARNQLEEHKHPINLDKLGRIAAFIAASAGGIYGAYQQIISPFKELESRIVELEKHTASDTQMDKVAERVEQLERQNIRDEKYREMVKDEEAEIKEIKRDLSSTSESLMDLFRLIRRK